VTLSVAIQAGGQSSRMGHDRDKALVDLNGRPMIAWVLDTVSGLGAEVITEVTITTNQPEHYDFADGIRLVDDDQPGAGALAGLRTAISAATHEWVLVLACDMPFVRHGLLTHLISNIDDECDVVIPQWQKRLQPFPAVYHRRCLGAIDDALARGEMSMRSFRDDVRLHIVDEAAIQAIDPDGVSFININTPEELKDAQQLLQSRSSIPSRKTDITSR